MNSEEIIAMAKEAGMNPNSDPDAINALGKSVPLAWIEKLCALVAEKAAAKEREACLEIADMEAGLSAHRIAQRIRARGTKEGV